MVIFLISAKFYYFMLSHKGAQQIYAMLIILSSLHPIKCMQHISVEEVLLLELVNLY